MAKQTRKKKNGVERIAPDAAAQVVPRVGMTAPVAQAPRSAASTARRAAVIAAASFAVIAGAGAAYVVLGPSRPAATRPASGRQQGALPGPVLGEHDARHARVAQAPVERPLSTPVASAAAAGEPPSGRPSASAVAFAPEPSAPLSLPGDGSVQPEPATGLRVAAATADGPLTTVDVTWDRLPDGAGPRVRLEMGETAEGPWRAAGPSGGASGAARLTFQGKRTWVRLAGKSSAAASLPIRVAGVVGRSYDLGRQVIPAAPFNRAEVAGHVRFPADFEARATLPLILIMHGNNGVCRSQEGVDYCRMDMIRDGVCPDGMTPTPNGEGMLYLAETLAARGMVAVVIKGNSTNCVPLPGTVQGKVVLLVEHLRRWRRWVKEGGAPFGTSFVGKLDLAHVGLVGHSNGAEAAALVPELLGRSRWDAQLQGVRIASIATLASSDSLMSTPDTEALLSVLASCDQQVTFMEGKRIFDRSLPGRTAPRAEAYIVAANHNGFNAQMIHDESLDSPTGSTWSACPMDKKLPGDVQRRLVGAMVAGWMQATARPDPLAPQPWMRAEAPLPSGIAAFVGTPVDVRWSYFAPERVAIDTFEGHLGQRHNSMGGENRFEGFEMAARCYGTDCDREFDQSVWGLRLHWDRRPARATFPFPPVDATVYPYLSLRAALCLHADLNPADRDQSFKLGVEDSHGNRASISLGEASLRLPYPSLLATPDETHGYTREQLHTLRVPLSLFRRNRPDIDLRSLTSVFVEMGTVPAHPKGAVILSALELTR